MSCATHSLTPHSVYKLWEFRSGMVRDLETTVGQNGLRLQWEAVTVWQESSRTFLVCVHACKPACWNPNPPRLGICQCDSSDKAIPIPFCHLALRLIENVGSHLKPFGLSSQSLKLERIKHCCSRNYACQSPQEGSLIAAAKNPCFIFSGNLMEANIVKETFFYNSYEGQTSNLIVKNRTVMIVACFQMQTLLRSCQS